jgi:hypothetical protein
MHKLIEYICDELEELERKADKEGKLSMAEIQYGDMLAHFKKNLLKGEEMYGEEGMYSMDGGSYAMGDDRGGMNGRTRRGGRSMRGGNSYRYEGEGSYARGRGRNAKRDAMGRYSSRGGYSMAGDEMIDELRDLMQDAPDEQTRMEFQRFIQKIEQMQ